MTQTYTVTGMTCGSCEVAVKNALQSLPHVKSAEVSKTAQQAKLELEKNKKTPRRLTVSPQLPAPQQVMSLRQAFDSAKTSIPLCRAAGKICAEQVSFYPPGIPVLLPGELITEAIIAYCENMKNLNLNSDLILQRHSLHLCRHVQIHSPQF